MGFLLSLRLFRLWQTGTLPRGCCFSDLWSNPDQTPVSTPGKDGSMVRIAFLALVLALAGWTHFGVLLDLVSAGGRCDPGVMAKAGNSADPDGVTATSDAGGANDPDGATAPSDVG